MEQELSVRNALTLARANVRLPRNPSRLKRLHVQLANARFQAISMQSLANAIRANTTLTHVTVSVPTAHVALFLSACQHLPHLQALDLTQCQGCAVELVTALVRAKPALKRLRLDRVRLEHCYRPSVINRYIDEWDLFRTALSYHESLQTIELVHCTLVPRPDHLVEHESDNDCDLWDRMLSSMVQRSARTSVLTHVALVPMVPFSSTLASTRMSLLQLCHSSMPIDNNINININLHNNRLKSLELGGLSDEQLTMVAHGVQSKEALEDWTIHCTVNEHACRTIANVVRNTKTLQGLALVATWERHGNNNNSNNLLEDRFDNIGEDDDEEFVDAVEDEADLVEEEEFDVHNNNINTPQSENNPFQHFSFIIEAFHHNQCIQEFELHRSPLMIDDDVNDDNIATPLEDCERVLPWNDLFNMVEANYFLEHVVLLDIRPLPKEMQFYLMLNQRGRGQLLLLQYYNFHDNNPALIVSREQWIEKLVEVQDDLDCLYYFLSVNPPLCRMS